MRNGINNRVKTLLDGIMDYLASKGIDAASIGQAGCIGANVVKLWKVRKE